MRSSLLIRTAILMQWCSAALDVSLFRNITDDTTIEVLWLQDFSAISDQGLLNLKQNLVPAFDELKDVFKHSRFGIAGFVDKPVEPHGDLKSGDYCYRLRYPLTRYTDRLHQTLQKALPHSGRDWQENQLGAMINAVDSAETRWTEGEKTVDGYQLKKILVVATNSGFHKEGDSTLPNVHTGLSMSEDDCSAHDYPSIAQTKQALKSTNTLPVFLVTEDVFPLYRELMDNLGINGVVYFVQDDMSNVKEALHASLNVLLSKNEAPCTCGLCCFGPGCCRNRKCGEEAAAVRIILEERQRMMNLTAVF